MTDDERLAEIKKLCDAATPGPWTVDHLLKVRTPLDDGKGFVAVGDGSYTLPRNRVQEEANARFIAAARTAVPLLLGMVEALRRERDEADRRAGAAKRKLEALEEQERRRDQWMREQKQALGYALNVSFDDVWVDVLRQRDEARAREARLKEATEAAHYALCFRYQDQVISDPPLVNGQAQWRVWHLDTLARRQMNRADQLLYDLLIRTDAALAASERGS